MADQVVKSSITDWKTECQRADAAVLLDRAEAGIVAVAGSQPYDRAYEFSNGRKFKDGKGPYA